MPTIDIQYFKKDTLVHRLHPLTKIIFELSVLVIAAAFNEPLFLAMVILWDPWGSCTSQCPSTEIPLYVGA